MENGGRNEVATMHPRPAPYLPVGVAIILIFGIAGGWTAQSWPIVSLIGAFLLGGTVLAFFLLRLPTAKPPLMLLLPTVNLLAASAIVWMTGGPRSPFWLLFLLGAWTGGMILPDDSRPLLEMGSLGLMSVVLLLPPAVIIPLDWGGTALAATQVFVLWLTFVIRRRATGLPEFRRMELLETETRFRQLNTHLQEVFYLVDLRDGLLLYVSPAYEEIWGRPIAGAKRWPQSFAEAVHPEDRERFHQVLARQKVGQSTEIEYRIVRPDGTVYWVLDRAYPIRDQNGKNYRIAGFAENFTDRKQAQQALELSEERYRTLTEAAHESIFIVGLNGQFEYVNSYTSRYFDCEPADMVGGRPEDYFPPEAAGQLSDAIEQVRQSTQPSYVEYQVPLSGEMIWLGSQLVPLRDARGQVHGVLGVARDISEQREGQEAIRKLNVELEARVAARTAQLAAKNKELETFTYSVSHDLKAPLRGIDGYSRILLIEYLDKLDADGQHYLKSIRRSTQQMNDLITDLLAYYRIEKGNLTMEPLNPTGLVEAVLNERQQDIEARRVQIRVDLPCGRVFAEREGLILALRNLLDNALKFTSHQPLPHIEFAGEKRGDNGCLLWVRDNGSGFDMAYQDKVFEIFHRLNRAEDYPGTGIGLALVRKAMERIGGRVWAESWPGQGATFYLEIPSFRSPSG